MNLCAFVPVLIRVDPSVGRFRASRDVPLPYDLATPTRTASPSCDERPSERSTPQKRNQSNLPSTPDLEASIHGPARASTDITPFPSHTSPRGASLRQRRAHTTTDLDGADLTPVSRSMARVGTAITSAHAEDFERRLPPLSMGKDRGQDSSDEEEEEEEDQEEEDRRDMEGPMSSDEDVEQVEQLLEDGGLRDGDGDEVHV